MSNCAMSTLTRKLLTASHAAILGRSVMPSLSVAVLQGHSVSHSIKNSGPLLYANNRHLHTSFNLYARKTNPVSQPDEKDVDKFHDTKKLVTKFSPAGIFPNPIRVITNWVAIQALKLSCDPGFNVSEFKRGAMQAIITVTDMLRKREWGDLKGLVEQSVIDKFRANTSESTKENMDLLNIDHNEIQLIVLKDVFLQQIVDTKYCDISVSMVAHKRQEDKERDLVYFFTVKFHRNYTSGVVSTWTISLLNFVVAQHDWEQ